MSDIHFDVSMFMGSDMYARQYQAKYTKLFTGGENVLDIGCGHGVFLELLREANIRGIGIDTSSHSIDGCKQKRLEVYQTDVSAFLDSYSQKFDGIFCSHVVEHFNANELFKIFQKVYRALNENGKFIIITPNFKNIEVVTSYFWMDITHVRPYPLELLEAMLVHTGFSIAGSGVDQDTTKRIPRRNVFSALKHIVRKIRFGEYYGTGDNYIIARK